MAISTPWGTSQAKEVICRGVTFHSTAGHGGALVSKGYAKKNLSASARDRAIVYGGYYCFEEDCAILMVLLELPQSRLRGQTEEDIIKSLSLWYPDYLIERGITPDPEAYARYQQWQLRDKMRAEKHPDLIVSAMRLSGTEVVKVHTADGKAHFVTPESYANRKDLNLLSNCELVENFTQTTDMYY